MSLSVLEQNEIIRKYQRGKKDTGSSEVQIALLTGHIMRLTEHLKINKKDQHTRHGLLMMVSRRRRLMKYLKRTFNERYQFLIQSLGLRDQ